MHRPRQLPNRRGGFTMIEMLIVVAIIGIFAALAINAGKDLVPRFRAKHAAMDFAASLEHARILAIETGRQSKVEVVDWDSSPYSWTGSNFGEWEISVGNKRVASTSWDVLPLESAGDSSKSEGTYDISESGREFKRDVSLVEPDVTEITFGPDGMVANYAAFGGRTGSVEFIFVNKAALAREVTETFTVKLWTSGMTRINATTAAGGSSLGGDSGLPS